MTLSFPPPPADGLAILGMKVFLASRVFDAKLGAKTMSQRDYLLASFVFGLTAPFYQNQLPELHLDVCRRLLEQRLSAERTEAALRKELEASEVWLAAAAEATERAGQLEAVKLLKSRKNGHA